jgi:transcription termination factor Rho
MALIISNIIKRILADVYVIGKGQRSHIRHPPSARMALIISNISERELADVNILIEIYILIEKILIPM